MSFKVVSAGLVSSGSAVTAPVLLREEFGHVVFTGRSNVGKSSLLNALTRDKIARTSAAAGKTRLANVFRVTVEGGPGGPGQWTCYFVDLPGYGYARGGAESVRELAGVVDTYLKERVEALRSRGAILLLIDSRHPGLASDLQIHRQISDAVAEPHVIATKIDKLSQSERTRNLRELARLFGTPAIPVSTTTGEGLSDVWNIIANRVRSQSTR